jgi:cytochrome b involved in lipid metabolism
MMTMELSRSFGHCRPSSVSVASMNKLDEAVEMEDDLSLAETASVDSSADLEVTLPSLVPLHQTQPPQNSDYTMCLCCQKRELKQNRLECSPSSAMYTRCQVRQHNHKDSCWLVADRYVYDATETIRTHPGGMDCILRKAGGREDCSMDIIFHSLRGREMWKRKRIGRLIECGEDDSPVQWWMFWSK